MDYILQNPYTPKANSYKGQLHCHSDAAGGLQSPFDLVTAYKTAGYDFCCLTDHDILTVDPGVSGILFILGIEEAIDGWKHIAGTNITSNPTESTPQELINEIQAQSALVWMAHPGYEHLGWTDTELETYKGYTGIEVYTPSNTDITGGYLFSRWDTLLSLGYRISGIAVDDCHDAVAGSFDYGMVYVFADSLTVPDIIASLKSGNFYSTRGPTMTITESNGVISVTTMAESTIEWITYGGMVTKTTAATTSDTYNLSGSEVYVRVVITRDSDGKKAFTNPIFVIPFVPSPKQYANLLDLSPIDRTDPLCRIVSGINI